MKKKNSSEAYVYWFYNIRTFMTYIGSRAGYAGSYKDDFLKVYKSSSENEDFLTALENGELVGEVIAVFTDECYEEAAFKALLYEQELIYLFWKELGQENSYNLICWHGHCRSNPFYRYYPSGQESPLYRDDILVEDVIRLNREERLNICDIAKIYNVGVTLIHSRFVEGGVKPIVYMDGDKNGRWIDIDINKIIELTDKGYTVCEIARELNVDPGLIHKRCDMYGIRKNPIKYLKGLESPNYIEFDFDEVVKLNIEKRLNANEISEIIGVSTNLIRARAKELGIELITYRGNENNGRWIDVNVEDIKKLAAEDYSKPEIAEKLGISYCVIDKRCKDNNIETRKKLKLGEHAYNYKIIDTEKLLELYNQGLTTTKIAEYFGTTGNLIRNRLYDLGLKLNKKDQSGKNNPMYGVSLNGPANGRYIAIPYDKLYELRVIKKMSKDNIGKEFGCSGRVVNRRLKEYGIE